MSDMTPAQAADYTELAFASTLRLGARPAHALLVLIDHARAAAPEGGDWGWPSDPWAHFTGEYIAKATEEGRFTDADIDVIADLMAHADQSRPHNPNSEREVDAFRRARAVADSLRGGAS